jgi:hypothetical protein
MSYISRYQEFIQNNKQVSLPFVEIFEQTSDKFVTYVLGRTRFDRLALKYYDDPTLGWLILYANPIHSMEFDFDDGDILRIPFPVESALQFYFDATGKELIL